MTRSELSKIMWEQADTLVHEDNGTYAFAVKFEDRVYRSYVTVTDADLPGDEDGPDYDAIYDDSFTPYSEALDDLLDQINTHSAAAALGTRGGAVGGLSTSPAKAAASRENGKLGGRPKTTAEVLHDAGLKAIPEPKDI